MNHIYLHSSNLEQARILREDPYFQAPYEYGAYEMQRTHRNEYGRIRTPTTYYHILIGQIPQHNCPWCGIKPILKKIKESDGLSFSKYQLQCPKCEACGPTLNISPQQELNEKSMQWCTDWIQQRYQCRLPWDHKLTESIEPTA